MTMLSPPPQIVFQKKVSLSSAQILAMGTTPIQILPAPGIGYAYLYVASFYELLAGSTPYTSTGSQAQLYYNNAVSGNAEFDGGDSGILTVNVNTCVFGLSYPALVEAPIGVITSLVENQPIFYIPEAPYIGGNGTASVTVCYTIVSVEG